MWGVTLNSACPVTSKRRLGGPASTLAEVGVHLHMWGRGLQGALCSTKIRAQCRAKRQCHLSPICEVHGQDTGQDPTSATSLNS